VGGREGGGEGGEEEGKGGAVGWRKEGKRGKIDQVLKGFQPKKEPLTRLRMTYSIGSKRIPSAGPWMRRRNLFITRVRGSHRRRGLNCSKGTSIKK